VETQVRVTAAELDLLCKNRVNGRTLYVECKAHRDPLSSNELKNLLGTITLKNYDEGWLISAGALGKDAKGFQHEWEQKPSRERQKLSIYTPDRIIEAFAAAKLIQLPPSAPLPNVGLLIRPLLL
jgi:restriction endonuclease